MSFILSFSLKNDRAIIILAIDMPNKKIKISLQKKILPTSCEQDI